MMTLQEYDEAALKILSNWRCKVGPIRYSDELIGRMVRFMATADWKYDPKKCNGMTMYDYRQMRAIYAIREYIKEKKITRNRISLEDYYDWYTDPLEYNEKAAKKIKFIMHNCGLNTQENEMLSYFISGLTVSQAADKMGINYNKGRNLYKSAMNKMKKLTINKE